MDSIFNDDKYKTLHYNSSTGKQDRLWIRYGDNTFEPVRRDGNLNRKSRNKPGAPDWWVTDRPQGWNPAKHGHKVTLNHDYGAGRKPNAGTGPPASGTSTIARGGEGFWEYEARQKATEAANPDGGQAARPRNLAQDARELRQRERVPRSSAEHARDLGRREKEQPQRPESKDGPLTYEDFARARDRMYSGIGKAVVEGGKGAAKAVGRTTDELMHNKDLHKGVEFGARAAWEVTKEVANKAGQDAFKAATESFFFDKAEKLGKVGRMIKSVANSPAVVAGRHTVDVSKQVEKGLEEYPQLARDLGARIKGIKRKIYKK
jgi:hypothetical protein